MRRVTPVAAVAAAALFLSAASLAGQKANSLSDEEKKLCFELLFNGQDLKGWEHKGNWKVEDGIISRDGKGGSLVYKVKPVPDDFELRFEWKVAKGSNSGLYYRPTQMEYQILDNQVHADGKNPRTSAASLYFCMAPAKDMTKPVGEWNEGKVVCQGSVIQHWLNGVKVICFDYADPRWEKEVALLKRRGGDPAQRGEHLSLQDHNDPVWYRSIRLREVPKTEKMDATPVTPAAIPEEALQKEQQILERIDKGKKKS